VAQALRAARLYRPGEPLRLERGPGSGARAADFLRLAASLQLETRTVAYPLGKADDALADLRAGRLQGAAVLVP